MATDKKPTEKQTLGELTTTHDFALAEFMPIIDSGYENQRYRRGIHWTDKEKSGHRKERRHPYAVTFTATKFNRHLAEQRANRTQWKVKGRGEEDELQAELDTQAFKYTEDINKFKYVESEIYEDGLGKKYGVLLIEPDYTDNPQGDIKLSRWYFDQVVWDVNSRAYDLNEDCGFIDRWEWYTREQVIQMYPEKKDVLRVTRADFENDTRTRKKVVNYYRRDKGKDLIKVIWRQQKEYAKVWKVIPLRPGEEVTTWDSLKEAEADLNQRVMAMVMPPQDAMMPIDQTQVLMLAESLKSNYRIEPVTQTQVKEICWTGTNILQEKVIDWTDKYTVIPYFALNDDGYYFNLIDLVKDPQRGFDRLFSMIDKSIAKNIKGNNYQLDETGVRPEVLQKLDYHIRKMVEGGHILPVLKKDAIQPIGTFNNVQVEMTLIPLLQSIIEDLFGGNTFQGLDSKQKQTATEASILERAARLGTFIFIDNLMRWKQQAGEVLYDCILNTYTYEMKMNISGEVLGEKIKAAMAEAGIYKMSDNYDNQGYLTYNKGGQRLRQNKMNVMVSEVELSETTRALQYEQLKQISVDLINAGGMGLPPEQLLSASNLDPTVKFGVQKAWEQQAAMIAEEKAQQMELEKMKLTAQTLPAIGTLLEPKEEKKNGKAA